MSKHLFVLAFCGVVTLAGAVAGRAQDAPQSDKPTPQTAADAESTPTPASPDGAEEQTPEDKDLAPAEISADDVLREFQRERPQAEPLLPQSPGNDSGDSDAVGVGAASGRARHLPDGFFLVDRVGRLVQDGNWWTITFTSDNNPDEAPDPPMKLLPNQMLERAIREAQSGARAVDFIVSGEVTDFMGENYLLLRKLMRKRELGNFSK